MGLVGERVPSVEEIEWLPEYSVVSGEATLIRAAILLWSRQRSAISRQFSLMDDN